MAMVAMIAHLIIVKFCSSFRSVIQFEIRKTAKIRKRYNQVPRLTQVNHNLPHEKVAKHNPHLTQDGKVTKTQLTSPTFEEGFVKD